MGIGNGNYKSVTGRMVDGQVLLQTISFGAPAGALSYRLLLFWANPDPPRTVSVRPSLG